MTNDVSGKRPKGWPVPLEDGSDHCAYVLTPPADGGEEDYRLVDELTGQAWLIGAEDYRALGPRGRVDPGRLQAAAYRAEGVAPATIREAIRRVNTKLMLLTGDDEAKYFEPGEGVYRIGEWGYVSEGQWVGAFEGEPAWAEAIFEIGADLDDDDRASARIVNDPASAEGIRPEDYCELENVFYTEAQADLDSEDEKVLAERFDRLTQALGPVNGGNWGGFRAVAPKRSDGGHEGYLCVQRPGSSLILYKLDPRVFSKEFALVRTFLSRLEVPYELWYGRELRDSLIEAAGLKACPPWGRSGLTPPPRGGPPPL